MRDGVVCDALEVGHRTHTAFERAVVRHESQLASRDFPHIGFRLVDHGWAECPAKDGAVRTVVVALHVAEQATRDVLLVAKGRAAERVRVLSQ